MAGGSRTQESLGISEQQNGGADDSAFPDARRTLAASGRLERAVRVLASGNPLRGGEVVVVPREERTGERWMMVRVVHEAVVRSCREWRRAAEVLVETAVEQVQ
jgi:hypothetical protein